MKRILNFAAPVVALALIFGSCAQETTTFPASSNPSKMVVMNGLTGSSEASIDIVIGDDTVISGLSSLEYSSAFEVDPGTEEMLVLI